MFSGIVEETGRVVSMHERAGGWRFSVEASVVTRDVALGDSVAVNGCCLTVVDMPAGALSFDVLEETLRVTNLDTLPHGGLVNLERSLRFDGRVGGHLLTGHVDATGEIVQLEERGKDVYLEIRPGGDFRRYLVRKGCIAVDGISLTIADTADDGFSIWLIPHTLAVTNLGRRQPGERVNLEFDLLGKYVERMLALQTK